MISTGIIPHAFLLYRQTAQDPVQPDAAPVQRLIFPHSPCRFLRRRLVRGAAAHLIALGDHPAPGFARGDQHHLDRAVGAEAPRQGADLGSAMGHPARAVTRPVAKRYSYRNAWIGLARAMR